VQVSSVLAAQTVYPFVRLEEAKRRRAAAGVTIFDFGMGDPREPTDDRIKRALVDALEETSGYPAAVGLPELRTAIGAWIERRFSVDVDPERELIPTYGS
jgi:LL-diaminopimelate aminotransferase